MTMFDLIRKMMKKPAPVVSVDLNAIRQRNQARIEQIKLEMGAKYILHPSHNKTRLDTPRPV